MYFLESFKIMIYNQWFLFWLIQYTKKNILTEKFLNQLK